VGAVRLVRLDRAPLALLDAAPDLAPRASLASTLDAEILPGASGRRAADPSLALLATLDEHLLASQADDARARFLWLVAGVVAVVAAGLGLLTRSVRREVALARRKEDFVAAVTHELKTPLAGIRMYADMLREGWVSDPDAAARYAGRIIDESDRLGHLVDQVLDLAALERGVARAHAVPGDLGAAVRDAALLVAARAEAAGVSLAVDVAEGLPPLPFDPRLVRPLVLNLLDNAIKYSEGSGEKRVQVSLVRDSDRAVLSVEDRGVGIPARVQKRLFEPFQRGGDEMTRTAPGVGIGLALVRRYAEAHGARVRLESEEGRGTRVTVAFPI
jgi:signal transduction histidine kinase